MKIVFATNNQHKLREIREILGPDFEIVSLSDIGCHEDIPETGNTLEENAHQKAEYIFDHYHLNCFADDTGLEVEALGGAPGVHSARYAEGTDHDSEARFRTVISLITMEGDNPVCSREYQFEGEVRGRIATEKHGTEGFGYDPLFIPDGYDKSFAELGEEIKNTISHRAKAVEQLAVHLKSEML